MYNSQCPIKELSIKQVKLPWLNDGLLDLMYNRDEMYKRAKRTSDQNDWAEAKRLQNLVKLGCTRARADFVKENTKKKHEKDPLPPQKKRFWKEMQEMLPGKKKKSNIFN